MVSLIQVFQIEKIIANLHFILSLYSRVLIKNVILESIKFIFWNNFYTAHDLFFKNYYFYNIFPAFWHKKSSIYYWNYFKIQNHRGVTSFETWESCSKANFQSVVSQPYSTQKILTFRQAYTKTRRLESLYNSMCSIWHIGTKTIPVNGI